MTAARVAELWRYPVKSMDGEQCQRLALEADGVPADRGWAVWSPDAISPLSAKRVPELMQCQAQLTAPGHPPRITLPAGASHTAGTANAAAALSRLIGRRTSLWPHLSPPAIAALRAPAAASAANRQLLRSALGLAYDASWPAAEQLPRGVIELADRAVGLQDAAPLLIVTTASVTALARQLPGARVDRRRFRPNVLLETDPDAGFIEQSWIGQRFSIGNAELEVIEPCKRCAMTTHGFDDLPPAPEVLRTLAEQTDARLGVYARVVRPGDLGIGQVLHWDASSPHE